MAPRRLLRQVDRLLGGAVKLRTEDVEDIPWTPSGKYSYVVRRVPLEF